MLLRSRLAVTAVLLIPSLATASPRARVAPDVRASADDMPTGSVCSRGPIRCQAHVQTTPAGEIRIDAGPNGLGPTQLQSAYQIDPNITTTPTIAIVDAFGYANVESDLAQYRSQFGLPPCTRANGCLKVVNQNGQTSPLPDDPPPDDDWTVEVALDMDMASAACPKCKITIVLSDDNSFDAMYTAQNSAAAAAPAVISDSWGGPTQAGQDLSSQEPYFNHPGIAEFVSGGDSGYNEGGNGPQYPSVSAYVIAVGGTRLVTSSNARGWAETAWAKGGSSCSFSIPKPAWQTSPCSFRAATDISAVGDPQTGVAVYNANNGGWMIVGGTSASAPLVASMFAATGHGNATAQQISQNASLFFDVTSGSNGSCGNVLCNAGTGWDGPTGYGSPSAMKLGMLMGGGGGGGGGGSLAVQITSPADNATVTSGFTVTANVTGPAVKVGLGIDGNLVATLTAPPYTFETPPLSGGHAIEVAAIDAAQNNAGAEIHVVVIGIGGGGGTISDPGGADTGGRGGCSAGGSSSGLVGVVLIGLVVRRRRR